MKKIKYLFIAVMLLFTTTVFAKEDITYVNIETSKISNDGKTYKSITKYETLDEFLVDYNKNKLPEVYLTTFLFDGVSSVKSPDLDDFIENNSNTTKIKTLEINVLNINLVGSVELSGSKKEMMIAVNTNEKKGNINIFLNNVNIDTDNKKTPVIYVYNKDINYTDARVTISAKKDTKNYLEGGKFKKVSLIPSEELENYKQYYTSEQLTNYEKYSSYYGIYTKKEISNLLFATVKADNEGLKDGDPYYFYKGSGAISSDIDLYFEGEGFLSVTSKNKEGIETKGHLVFSGGIGDYEIYAQDDCLNTTTSNSSNSIVHNDLIIDVNSLLAVVDDDGDEGDAIDSNGSLTINGGKIYAFAHSNSEDAGLDSETGTIINGGTIIATGNMADKISNESKQKYIYVNFKNKIAKDTLITIKTLNDEIITSFKTNKDITTLFYSIEDLDYDSFKIYTGGKIEGIEENGLYTKIDSYKNGTEIEYTTATMFNRDMNVKNVNNYFIKNLLLVEITCLVAVIIYILIDKNILKINKKL